MLKKEADIFSCNKGKPQYIIYTNSNCPKCLIQKERWDEEGILYVERDASRLKNPSDDIDKDALVESAFQNESLPVIIEL